MGPMFTYTAVFGTTQVKVRAYGKYDTDKVKREANHRAEQLHWTRPKAREGRPIRSMEERAFDREWRD